MAAVGHTPPIPPPTPPSCSECASKTQPAGGGPPSQTASRMWRSSDGKTRIDMPQTSVISDPISKHTIVLDHLKKEASIIPMPPPGAPAMPPGASPAAAAALHPSSVHTQDLGKSMIEGHEVEGKRYTLPHVPPPPKPQIPGMKIPGMKPPAAPSLPGVKMPAAPAVPGAKLPGAPSMPKPPGAPAPPPKPKLPATPSVAEVWTSVKLKTPVLTKVTTAAGEHTTYCKPTLTAEHPPTLFQVPPGYTIKPPTPPAVPKPPAMPKLPKT